MGDGLVRCAACDRRSSATAGTIFAGTRTPLTLWFAAAWYITNQKSGVSALGLQRALALGSYKTAWAWLHKFRRAMVRPSRDRLSGELEVDESYIGGVAPGKPGRGAKKKTAVAIAVEKRGRGMGRIRLARIADTSTDSLLPFIEEAIEAGSVVYTDACPASTASPRCSSAGCSAPTKAPSARSSSTTTWTNSPSASTAAAPTTAVSSSTGCSNRPSRSTRNRWRSSSAAARSSPTRSNRYEGHRRE